MEHLPDELLHKVFTAVPQVEAVGSLPQVCRQFRRALGVPSVVWAKLESALLEHVTARVGGRLTVQERMALLERWVQRCGASVRALECSECVDDDVSPCVVPILIRLPALEEVSITGNMEDTALSVPSSTAFSLLSRALGQCTSLKHLNLDLMLPADGRTYSDSCIYQCLAGTLGQLLSLESLKLGLICLPLEQVVSAVLPLSRLSRLSFHTFDRGEDDGYHVLPAAVSCLQHLQVLDIDKMIHFSVVEGWAQLPLLTVLKFQCIEFDLQADEDALPGVSSLTALKRLACLDCCFLREVGSMRGLTSLEELHITYDEICEAENNDFTPLLQLPADMWALTNLRRVTLRGAFVGACPAAVSHLVNLESLEVRCPDLGALPVLLTRLVKLQQLSLGYTFPYFPYGTDQVLDFSAPGDLAGLPQLQRLRFSHCMVRLSDSFAEAVGLTAVEFDLAMPEPGPSLEAVLQLHRRLRLQGRGAVWNYSSEGGCTEFEARLDEA